MYRMAASGNLVANMGEKRIAMRNEGGETRIMTFQMADMTKPLVSAGRITAKRHRIVLDDDDAYSLHTPTGRKVKLHKKDNVVVMKMQIMPPGYKSHSHTSNENGRLLGVLGSTRLED